MRCGGERRGQGSWTLAPDEGVALEEVTWPKYGAVHGVRHRTLTDGRRSTHGQRAGKGSRQGAASSAHAATSSTHSAPGSPTDRGSPGDASRGPRGVRRPLVFKGRLGDAQIAQSAVSGPPARKVQERRDDWTGGRRGAWGAM